MGMLSGYENDCEHVGEWWWWTKCKSDPRFDMSGWAHGRWDANAKIDEAVRSKAKELGIEPPSDIERGSNAS